MSASATASRSGALHGVPVGHEGHHRHRRHADRERHGAARGPHAARRRGRGAHAARRGRGDPRQDRHHRMRLLQPRQDAQSAQPRAHARRLLQRLGRRGRRRHGAARARQPDRRLGDPAGGVLRRATASSPRTASFRAAASCSSRARSTTSGSLRAAWTTSPCCSSSCRATTSSIRIRGRAPGFRFLRSLGEEPPIEPMLAFIKTPHWERGDADTKEAFAELQESLGKQVEEVELFPSATEAWDWHRTIMEAEMAANLEPLWLAGKDKLSEQAARADRARTRSARGRPSARAAAHRADAWRASTISSCSATTRSSRRRRSAPRRRVSARPAIRCSARCGRCSACRRSRCR